MATTKFDLVTPMRTLYSGEAEMIVCRIVDGEIAFLADHMPYIGVLEPGLVRIVGPTGDGDASSVPASGTPSGSPEVRLAVHGGFVEVKDNQVVMLADIASEASEIDVEQARRNESEASQRLAAAGDDERAAATAELELRWARARLEAAAPGIHV